MTKPDFGRFKNFMAVLVMCLFLAPPSDARDAPVIADLSHHLVKVTTGFSGMDVLLFGATDGPGDILLVVRGPATNLAVRRKQRKSGIWINGPSVYLNNVPGFYRIAASRPVEDMLPPESLKTHRIGIENLFFHFSPDSDIADPGERSGFINAMLKIRTDAGLFSNTANAIIQMGNRLFRTSISFPANAPIGDYLVEVYLVRGGEIVGAEVTPLNIAKIGLGAEIFNFAHDYPLFYGILAVFMALCVGWLANVILGKN